MYIAFCLLWFDMCGDALLFMLCKLLFVVWYITLLKFQNSRNENR